MPYANNNGTDQPAHQRSLISTFVVRCLDSIIPLVSISEISSLYLVSVTAQTGLSLPWSHTPKTGFLATRLKCLTSAKEPAHLIRAVAGQRSSPELCLTNKSKIHLKQKNEVLYFDL